MARGSPGSARAISGWGAGLTPGPESMPSASANHNWRLRRAAVAAQACDRSGRGLWWMCNRGELSGVCWGVGCRDGCMACGSGEVQGSVLGEV